MINVNICLDFNKLTFESQEEIVENVLFAIKCEDRLMDDVRELAEDREIDLDAALDITARKMAEKLHQMITIFVV